MRHATLAIGACHMDGSVSLMGMTKMLVKSQRIGKSFLVGTSALSLEHGHLVVQIITGLLISHLLIEIVLEFLENATFGGGIALEVVALAELLDGLLLVP